MTIKKLKEIIEKEIEYQIKNRKRAKNKILFEKLAAIEHERWSAWQNYVHAICSKNENGDLIIPKKFVEKWERQIKTPYAKLSEKEKESGRIQVCSYWDLIK